LNHVRETAKENECENCGKSFISIHKGSSKMDLFLGGLPTLDESSTF